MRIAVNGKALARANKGGVVRVATSVVYHMAVERPDIQFDVFMVRSDREIGLPAMPDNVRLVVSTSVAFRSGFFRSLWEQVFLPRAVRAGSYDILLNLANSAPVWLTPGVPQLLTIHDAGFLNRAWFSKGYSRYVEAVVRRAAKIGVRIVSVSHAAAADIRRELGEEFPIAVVYNDSDRPPSEVQQAAVPGPYILVLGSLNPRKNLTGAIAGFRNFAAAADQPYHLVIVGAAKKIFRDDPEIGPAGVAGDLIYTGYVSDQERWSYYSGASALLFPSYAEGFGLPILEALRIGTPVVASNIPVFAELFGEAIEMVEPDSPSEMAAALSRVCGDAGLRRLRIEKGKAVADRFSWAHSARSYLDLVGDIVEARP